MIVHRIASFFRRNATTIPLTIIAVSVLAMFLLLAGNNARQAAQIQQQNQLLEETKSIAQQLRDDSNSRNKQIDDLNRHLDCIVKFFAQRDRSNSSIANIQTCRITKNDDTSSTSPSSNQSASVQPRGTGLPSPTTQQPATQPSQPSQGGSSGTSGGSSSNGGTSNPPSSGDNQQPVRQLVQDIISLPLALIRQIPIVGGKP